MEPGYEPLGIGDGERDGIVYVPASAGPGAPLMLLFHGFGGTGSREIVAVRQQADDHGVIVVAPDSRGQSWDIIVSGRFGPDVEFVDQLMAVVPQRYDIDPRRFAVSGISDGASVRAVRRPPQRLHDDRLLPRLLVPRRG